LKGDCGTESKRANTWYCSPAAPRAPWTASVDDGTTGGVGHHLYPITPSASPIPWAPPGSSARTGFPRARGTRPMAGWAARECLFPLQSRGSGHAYRVRGGAESSTSRAAPVTRRRICRAANTRPTHHRPTGSLSHQNPRLPVSLRHPRRFSTSTLGWGAFMRGAPPPAAAPRLARAPASPQYPYEIGGPAGGVR